MDIKDAPVAAQEVISGLGAEGLGARTTPLHRDPSAPSSAPFFPTSCREFPRACFVLKAPNFPSKQKEHSQRGRSCRGMHSRLHWCLCSGNIGLV